MRRSQSCAPPSSRKPRTADGGGDDGGGAHDSVAGPALAAWLEQRAAAPASARSDGISDDEDDDGDAPAPRLRDAAAARDEADDEYFASDDRPLSGMKLKPLFLSLKVLRVRR